MSNHASQLGPGQIQFHQWCEPPIEPGKYTVDVAQSVTELGAQGDAAFKKQFEFFVAGPRFSLNPSEIYSVYPPTGQAGDFASSLPHIVFTRRTLPWERSVHAGPRKAGDKSPWMALLVFSAADFGNGRFPEIRLLSVGSLINPEAGDTFVGPRLELAAYEKKEDLCNTIELEWDVFQKVAPSLADLEYLGHVREVNTGNKETQSLLADGWFSVVLSNRFPEPERKASQPPLPVENRAYLVSLEGMTDYLPGAASTAKKPVRLAVLSSWSFQCREAFSFQASMSILDVGRLAVPGLGKAATTEAEKQVDEAWQQGYTALNHHTRVGEQAVSWYRGPLVPLHLAKQSNFVFRPAADAALRYSPLDGMMDVSYAASYQLGRLLALQDRHFATALYTYRSGVQRQIHDVLGRRRIELKLGGSKGGSESGMMSDYVKHLGSSNRSPAPPVVPGEAGVVGAVPILRDAGELKLTTDFDLTIPNTVCRWLGRLILLYRVPFTNLVADERMLPTNSIRFFHLDPNWVKCLLEGACSVGRSSSLDEWVDQRLRDKFLDFGMEQSLEVRAGTRERNAAGPTPIISNSAENPSVVTTEIPHGLATNDRIVISGVSSSDADINGEQTVTVTGATTFSVPIDARQHGGTGGTLVRSTVIEVKRTEDQIKRPNWPLTGFLLRSPVVEGWQGLEMRAWADSGMTRPLEPLRIDRLAPDIMLCIFNGRVNRIEIKQPPEGMHFGASVDATGFAKFRLRRLDASDPGAQLDATSRTDIPLRRADAVRVVNVAALVQALQKKLDDMKARDVLTKFTAADLGVEMVESPGRVIFDVTTTEGDAL